MIDDSHISMAMSIILIIVRNLITIFLRQILFNENIEYRKPPE